MRDVRAGSAKDQLFTIFYDLKVSMRAGGIPAFPNAGNGLSLLNPLLFLDQNPGIMCIKGLPAGAVVQHKVKPITPACFNAIYAAGRYSAQDSSIIGSDIQAVVECSPARAVF